MALLLGVGGGGRGGGRPGAVRGGRARRAAPGGGRGGVGRGVVGPTVPWSVRGPACCRVDGLFSTPTALADPPHGGRAPLIGGQTAHARHASAAVWLP